MNKRKPELLAPAGTKEALEAAIRAGADAVYFGGSRFNARMAADNFAGDAMGEAIALCAFYGVKSNITLNTLPYEREQDDVLRYAEQLYRWGADAVICADLGTASLLHRYFPDMELHASTQCAGHNTDAARFLAAHGFSRMVAAREISFADFRTICRESPIETEMFIHGAVCVSQSGGCLFSSLVGGRSGNRGACAQPCRLPYTVSAGGCRTKQNAEEYPLSLRDMSLAAHIPEILSLGVASLKIEGRMKSPAYVEGVTGIYRRLLDEERNADKKETETLAALFSRGGFTDGYFTGKAALYGRSMQGTRSEADKAATVTAEKAVLSGRRQVRRLPLALHYICEKGKPFTLSAECRGCVVTEQGDSPADAVNRPLTKEDIEKNITKLGQTVFSAETVTGTLDTNLILPLASLNALRRTVTERLEAVLRGQIPHEKRKETPALPDRPTEHKNGYSGMYPYRRQAVFLSAEAIPASARDFYDILYLPLDTLMRYPGAVRNSGVNGAVLPPVIFDGQKDTVRAMLAKAKSMGIGHLLLGNIGHIALARETGLILHGSLRTNLYTAESADIWAEEGFSDITLSPELTAPQIRDITPSIPKGVVTYGRLPLMTLERCILRESAGVPDGKPCSLCDTKPVSYLTDRRHIAFPVTRTFPHRNIVWNSATLYMADRPSVLDGLHTQFTVHYFTTETSAEINAVIRAYAENGAATPAVGAVRRIGN